MFTAWEEHYDTRTQLEEYTTIHVYSLRSPLPYMFTAWEEHYDTCIQLEEYTTIHVYSLRRTLPYMHTAGLFFFFYVVSTVNILKTLFAHPKLFCSFHNAPNSDMDYRILKRCIHVIFSHVYIWGTSVQSQLKNFSVESAHNMTVETSRGGHKALHPSMWWTHLIILIFFLYECLCTSTQDGP